MTTPNDKLKSNQFAIDGLKSLQLISDPDFISQEIIQAAIKIENYFKIKGVDKWELMGIASRNLVGYAPVKPPSKRRERKSK